MLLYDHREWKSGLPVMLKEKGLDLEEAQLHIGDYIISDRICLERKEARDFVSSLKDGRLWRQSAAMTGAFEVSIIVIEGSPRFPEESLLGAKAKILRQGVALLETKNIEETSRLIFRLVSQENSPDKPRKPKLTRKLRGNDEILEDMLSALPGVSISKASDLLDYFQTIKAVLAADSKELAKVPGIGPKTAENLAEIFSHQKGSLPWE